jgi:cupin 2 domain-containing protein
MSLNGNIFAAVPEHLDAELIEILARGGPCRLERIVSRGHSTAAGLWYDQDWDEWVLLLRGSATLRFAGDSEPTHLAAGDFLLIPAHRRHRVESTARDQDTVWLALHFAPDTLTAPPRRPPSS